MSSSTLTRTNSKNAKYKDYVSFLKSYKSGTKDDQNSDSGTNFSLNNSLNNSSSSVFSDHSENNPNMKKTLQETLKNIKNNSNEINHNKQPNSKVKTEMVIQINNPPEKFETLNFEVKNVNTHSQEPLLTVSHASKIFENNEKQLNGNSHQMVFKKNSIGEMTKRFENLDDFKAKAPIQKKNSINEFSKIFENGNKPRETGTIKKFNNFNTIPKAFTPPNSTERKVVYNTKPPIMSPKPEIEPPNFFKTNYKPSSSNSTLSSLSSLSTSPSPPHSLSPTPPMMCSPPLRVGSPPPVIVTSATPEQNIPPPPPPFEDLTQRVMVIPPPPLPPLLENKNVSNRNIPPAPPMPVHQKSTSYTKVPVSSNEKNDLVDGQTGTLNKNNPKVKKAVYGALRNMYGAYHDQANDYMATLPKNRVKKNNKLDGIIESIASQGGLDKMTGRANPTSNRED